MLSHLLQQKALSFPAFHPESSVKYVHLAGLLAYRIFNVFPHLCAVTCLLKICPSITRTRLTATGIAPVFHADFPFNRNDNALPSQTK